MSAVVLTCEHRHGQMMRTAARAVCPLPLPCPFCGHINLHANDWATHDEEIPAFECANTECGAMAPAKIWNQRA